MSEKISIIIPCYNAADYLPQCIESIQSQNWDNIEVICIDDGSSDDTLLILNKYKKQDQRIMVISHENKGVSESRNIGIAAATGEYIMFLDSDDWLDRNCLQKCFSAEFDLVCFSYNRIFKNITESRVLNISGPYDAETIQKRIVGLTGRELADPSQANSLVTACCKIYRSEIIQNNNVRFIDTTVLGAGEDMLFNVMYLQYVDGHVLVVDEPLYNYYRSNQTSITTLYKPLLIEQWEVLHQKLFTIVENKDAFFHSAFYNRIALSIIGLGLNEVENPRGYISQMKNFSRILSDPLYKKSYGQLNFDYFPLHWKLLFMMAKFRFTLGVFAMMKIMSILWKQKNK